MAFPFLSSFAQENQKFQLSIQLQPELTLHQNQYSYRWREMYTKATFNVGLTSAIQFNVTTRLFFNAGLAFISRRLNTAVFLDQSKLPPPHYSETKELNTTKYLSYRTLQIPINVGYNIFKNNKFKSFLIWGISANYLLNAYYKVGRVQYDASYKKSYWQGIGVNGGLGVDIQVTKKLLLTNALSYSIVNPVQPDNFLFSQDAKEISLPHKYLQISTGLKFPL